MKEVEKIPVVHFPKEEIEVRKKAIFCMLSTMGVQLEPEDVTLQMVYALRYIPVHLIMSGFVVGKLMSGYTERQVVSKYPVTERQLRTIKEKRRTFREKLLKKTEKDSTEGANFSI